MAQRAVWPIKLCVAHLTKHLDQTGVSQRVVGRQLAEIIAPA
jgi:hypothetical protein